MARKCIDNFSPSDLKGKRVFVRVDFNVPFNTDGTIADDTRINAALPTINLLIKAEARVILCSHLGRPNGQVVEILRMKSVAEHLGTLIGNVNVQYVKDCIGDDVHGAIERMPSGSILVLENVRFYKEEEQNDSKFAAKLAELADVYVNDAFGTAHRAHASTEGMAHKVSVVATGLLMEKELKYLGDVINEPKRPLGAIIGGSKVSSKIGVIESLIKKCDLLILGGGMVFTFLKARGWNIGNSLVENDKVDFARGLEDYARQNNVKLLLPTDIVIADSFSKDAKYQTVQADNIPDNWQGLDIGEESIRLFSQALQNCKTVIWNGPMGVFEFSQFAKGTNAIARELAKLTKAGTITIVGGGDSVAAIEQLDLGSEMSHISTGGGASLELLEGNNLPGVVALG
jgi:phosphoglycerate kinase